MTTTTRPRRKPQHLESIEQRLFVQRFRLDPQTKHLPACAIPNGGKRSAREAALMKAEGVTAGAPDWMLFVPRGPYHGLALEFKRPTGRWQLTESQAEFHDKLRVYGWQVVVVTSAEQAWTVLQDYLDAA